ncbi:MAG TPA: hypothetical protein GXX57_00465 [Firmicutes bacterium]|nr:hypothetical protein [Bacillota bacterium]
MLPRERVHAALRHERTDRIPFELGFVPAVLQEFKKRTGATSPEEYFQLDMRTAHLGPSNQVHDYQKYYSEDISGLWLDEFGVAHRPGGYYHFTKMLHPLAGAQDPAEILAYPFPDSDAPYRMAHLEAQVQDYHRRDLFVSAFVGHIFETAWYLRGMENLLMDFYLNQDLASALLDRITELNASLARGFAQAGVDMVRLGDDVGSQRALLMSQETWRKWLKPRMAKVIAAAKEVNREVHIWYHSDGVIGPILDDLVEIGVNVLNPVQPECMDPLDLRRRYGKKLAFWGTVGTQTIMPFGTPEEVFAYVTDRIRTLGKEGGLVLAPTHVLEPDVPWENITAFVAAARQEVRKVV